MCVTTAPQPYRMGLGDVVFPGTVTTHPGLHRAATSSCWDAPSGNGGPPGAVAWSPSARRDLWGPAGPPSSCVTSSSPFASPITLRAWKRWPRVSHRPPPGDRVVSKLQ